jgi:hypothetical protein
LFGTSNILHLALFGTFLDPVPPPSKPTQDDPFADFLFNDSTSNASSGWSSSSSSTTQVATSVTTDAFGSGSAAGSAPQNRTSAKDAIMALYGPSVPGATNPYGVPAGGRWIMKVENVCDSANEDHY